MSANPFNSLTTVQGKILAKRWAAGMLELPEFYIWDSETTGVDKEKDAIVQLSCLHHPTMIISNWIINPEMNVDPKAAKVHGRTTKSLEGKPNFSKIYKHVARRINGVPFVAYNADFDYTILQKQAARYGFSAFTPSTVVDAMLYAALSWGRKIKKDDGYYFQNPKLTVWAKYMQIPSIENAHDARADVLFVYESMFKLARMVVDG